MRIIQIATSFIAALLFGALATRAFASWAVRRERRSAHLAIATGLFALSQFIGANSGAFYNSLQGHQPPSWIGVTSGIISAVALYGFILFLFDFVKVPAIARAVALLGTAEFILLIVVERTSVKIVDQSFVFEGHPIGFRTYLYTIVGWYMLILGIMWLSFLVYGLRNTGLTRARMLYIASGFFLIFVVIGLIPLLLLENSTAFWRSLGTVLGLLVLLSAPLLFIGFTPPAWLKARYPKATRSRIIRRVSA